MALLLCENEKGGFEDLHVCRICLATNTAMKLLCNGLVDSFQILANQEVSSTDSLPKWICVYCYVIIKKFLLFRKVCSQSLDILKKIQLKKNSEVTDIKETILLEKNNLKLFDLKETNVQNFEYQPLKNDELPASEKNGEKIEQISKGIFVIESNNCNSLSTDIIDIKTEYDDGQFDASDDEPVIMKINSSKEKGFKKANKTLNGNGKRRTKKIVTKSTVHNTPSRNFDMTMVSVTTLTREQQETEIEEGKISEEYQKAPYKCDMCAKGFAHEMVYKEHKLKHDPVSGPFVCDLCTQRFNSRRNLGNHLETHSNRYSCRLCGKVVISRQNIMSHMYTEHDHTNQPIKCQLCNKLYKNRYTYAKHMRIHNNSREYKCHICPKVFLWKDNLNRHLTRHKNDKPFSCNQCSKSFYLKENLRDHQLVHSDSKRFYCVECDLSYASQVKLNQHLKRGTRHLKPEQFTFACSFCPMRYTNSLQLTMHVDRIHLKKRSHTCSKCEAAFVSKKSLQTHVKSVHEGFRRPKDQICETCGKGFSDKQVLKAHIRTHTGEKPFCCIHCGAKFAHSGAMYTHVKLIHLKVKRKYQTTNSTVSKLSEPPLDK